MEKRSEYLIPFISLPIGEHRYDFNINDSFFKKYENPLLKKALVKVEVLFIKSAHSLQFTFTFKGTINVECGRCLEMFDMPVDAAKHLLVRQVSDETEEMIDDEVLSISDKEQVLDLAPHIYDYLSLLIPINPIHSEDEKCVPSCNTQVMELLNKITVNPDAAIDNSRWDKLRNIKLN